LGLVIVGPWEERWRIWEGKAGLDSSKWVSFLVFLAPDGEFPLAGMAEVVLTVPVGAPEEAVLDDVSGAAVFAGRGCVDFNHLHICVYMYKNTQVYKCICGYVFMGRMQIVLPDDLEEKLRKKAAEKYGNRKGNISKAIEEAITAWLSKEN
jgi:hypothetical protein